jgi:hypothetical protein
MAQRRVPFFSSKRHNKEEEERHNNEAEERHNKKEEDEHKINDHQIIFELPRATVYIKRFALRYDDLKALFKNSNVNLLEKNDFLKQIHYELEYYCDSSRYQKDDIEEYDETQDPHEYKDMIGNILLTEGLVVPNVPKQKQIIHPSGWMKNIFENA